MEGARMTMLVLIAMIGGQRVAIDAANIESVVDLSQIIPVPLSAPHVLGLAAVRSRVLTVIDAAIAAGLPPVEHGNRALVIESGGHSYALRVDAVHDVAAPLGDIQPFDGSAGANWSGIATATIDTEFGFALLIDPDRLVGGTLAEAA
jgi:purine-binding chemotaxis protein CheW